MYSATLVVLLTTTWSVSAFRVTASNLGTRILKKQVQCRLLAPTPNKTTLDEKDDKFPSTSGDAYFNCLKALDDLKRMYISENYPDLITYPSKFPVKLPSGITLMLPSPPEKPLSKASSGPGIYMPVRGICMIYEQCKMISKNMNSEESYFKVKYVHCIALLNALKSKYVRESNIDLGNPHGGEKTSIKCNGEDVPLLSESLSENTGVSSLAPESTIYQKSTPASIQTINDIHYKLKLPMNSSVKKDLFDDSESFTSEKGHPVVYSIKRFDGMPTYKDSRQNVGGTLGSELNLRVLKNEKPIPSEIDDPHSASAQSKSDKVEPGNHSDVDSAIISSTNLGMNEANKQSNSKSTSDINIPELSGNIAQDTSDRVERNRHADSALAESQTEGDKDEPSEHSNSSDEGKIIGTSQVQGIPQLVEPTSQVDNKGMTEVGADDLGKENQGEEEIKQYDTSNDQDDSTGREHTNQVDNKEITEGHKSDVQEKNAEEDRVRADMPKTQDDSDDGEPTIQADGDDVGTTTTKVEGHKSDTDDKQKNTQKVDKSVLVPQGGSISVPNDMIANSNGQNVEPNVEKADIRVTPEPNTAKPPTPDAGTAHFTDTNPTVKPILSISSRFLGDQIMAMEEDCRELLNMANKALGTNTPESLADIDSKHAQCEDSLNNLKHLYISDHRLDVARYRDVFPITLSSGAKRFVLLPRPQGPSPSVQIVLETRYLPVPLLRQGLGSRYERENLFDDSVDWETVGSRRNKIVIENPAFISNEKLLEYFNQGPSTEASTLTKFANMLHMNIGRSEDSPPGN